MVTTNGILATTDSNSCMFRTTSTGGLRPRSVVKKLDLRQPYTRPIPGLLLSYAFVLRGTPGRRQYPADCLDPHKTLTNIRGRHTCENFCVRLRDWPCALVSFLLDRRS